MEERLPRGKPWPWYPLLLSPSLPCFRAQVRQLPLATHAPRLARHMSRHTLRSCETLEPTTRRTTTLVMNVTISRGLGSCLTVDRIKNSHPHLLSHTWTLIVFTTRCWRHYDVEDAFNSCLQCWRCAQLMLTMCELVEKTMSAELEAVLKSCLQCDVKLKLCLSGFISWSSSPPMHPQFHCC